MRTRCLWLAIAIALFPAALPAQGTFRKALSFAGKMWSTDRSFSLLDENDALGGTSDSAYTQGIRLRWDFGAWPQASAWNRGFRWVSLAFMVPGDFDPPDRECAAKDGRNERPCGMVYLALAQTEYTPPELRATLPNYDTRPYAGYLYASFAGTILYPQTSVTSELTIGTIGPRSAARATQSLAHWTWSSDATQPMGWHNQLRNAWQISLRNVYASELLEYCWNECTTGKLEDIRLFDVVPNAELVLGTLMRRASFGGAAHLGYRFPDLLTPFRIPTTADPPPQRGDTHFWHDVGDLIRRVRESFWGMVFVSYDRRYVETNDLITGSHNDGGSTGWRTLRRINLERDVGEYAWGFSVCADRVTAGWQRVTRTTEFRPAGGPHRFGVAYISIFTPAQ